MRRRDAAFIALVGLVGCASAPRAYQVERSQTYAGAEFDEVWSAVIEIFSENNWPIDAMEKDSGLIASKWASVNLRSSWVDCGDSGISIDRAKHGEFNVFVREVSEGVQVTVNSRWGGTREGLGQRLHAIECVSTGALEQEIHHLVRSKL